MKLLPLIALIVFSGCAMSPEQRQTLDEAMRGAYAAQLRQDAINAERARNAAIANANRPIPMNCYLEPPNKWTGERFMRCR